MSIIIPHSFQIVLDDLGWFCGTDDRESGGPSRTGCLRRHCAEDYKAINELGEKLNMKINCGFVVGEWDPDNRLKCIPHLSQYGDNWDNALHLDADEMKKVIEVINNSPYIDVALHGLLHGYYMEGTDNTDTSDFYYTVNKEVIMVNESEIRKRIEMFFELMNYYGVKKKINSFIPPSFVYRWDELSKILADYGIEYISTIYKNMVYDGATKPTIADIENGIITVDRNNNKIPWNMTGCSFEALPVLQGIFGVHWPNFLSELPENNSEVVDEAVRYFKMCGESFGTILSRDMKFCATQSLYKRFANVEEKDGKTYIDISEVPFAKGMDNKFYVSSESPIKEYTGCNIKVFEEHELFVNYEVTPTNKTISLL